LGKLINFYIISFNLVFLLFVNISKAEWVKYITKKGSRGVEYYYYIDKSKIIYDNNIITITYMESSNKLDNESRSNSSLKTTDIDCDRQKKQYIGMTYYSGLNLTGSVVYDHTGDSGWSDFNQGVIDGATVIDFYKNLCADKDEFQKNEIIKMEKAAIKADQERKDKEQQYSEELKRIEKEKIEKDNQLKKQDDLRKREVAEGETRKQQEIQRKKLEDEQLIKQKEKEKKDQINNM